ncbi:hypothetical protein GALL_294600 [mine drainage metagenome]|uniref:Uncharacterized protein n=1 Tax=mine drainage metagenome TaxID=410659 RepID=A0A1J5RKK8_9ZZZZ
MKRISPLLVLTMLAGIAVSGMAQADRVHVGIGLGFGVPYPGYYYPPPYPYYYPYPYYPPVVVAPAQPPVYVEQGSAQPAPAAAETYYWYHCEKPDGYYPYIKECPGGWQRVAPSPVP